MRNTNIFTKDDYEKMGSPSRLEIPYGYTKIDGWAFNGSHIQSCSLPYSIEEIGDFAFNECMQLTSCNIPSSVLIIGVHAFGRCYNLSTITIPSSVVEIRMGAFCDSGIYSINIPDSVEIIGGYLFRHCINLKQIDVERKYIYEDGVLYNAEKTKLILALNDIVKRDFTVDDSITTICAYAFYGCENIESITIAEKCISIESSAFGQCYGLTSINIPKSVTEIKNYLFSNCESLTSITLTNSIKRIEDSAFLGCCKLQSISIPASVTYIGQSVFDKCYHLSNFAIESKNYIFKAGILYNKNKTKIIQVFPQLVDSVLTIPNTITDIEDYQFQNCDGVEKAIISNSVKTIGKYSFSCFSLTSVYISSSVKDVGIGAFSGGSVIDIELEGTNFIFEKGILYNNDKTSIIQGLRSKVVGHIFLAKSVTHIKSKAFVGCDQLNSVIIPNSVTIIEEGVFQDCKRLTRIVICESSPIIEKLKKDYNDKIILLHELPEEDYSGKNEFDEKEFTMDDFEKMGSPRNCIIPYGYTEIEKYAFYDIDSFTLPNSFTTIKELQFCGCYLDRITIPSSVIEIDGSAFCDCSSLIDINVEGWNFIYEDGVLFNRDKSKIVLALSAVLKGEYSVPKSVVEIMDSAFSDCINLDSIDIPDTVIIIGKDVFNYKTTIYLNETSPLWGQGF